MEYYRLWDYGRGTGGNWDTDFIDIPADTPDDKVEEAIREAASKVKWDKDESPVIVGLYCDQHDEEHDESI